MSISDKTRKVLWGRSGNQCAICKREIVIDSTAHDDESVVADECHIISSRLNGPRHDPSFPSEEFDSYDNLMLLCRTHHKMVDDQSATFTTDILRQTKADHEVWVSRKLAEQRAPQPVRFRRVEENIPVLLSRLSTGKEVLGLVSNAMAYAFDHEELKSQKEVDLVSGFFQLAQDWGDLSANLEAGDRVQTAYELGESLQSLEEAGFLVFGGRDLQLMEGGLLSGPADWLVAVMRVLRKNSESIMQVNLDDMKEVDAQPSVGVGHPTTR